MEIITLDLGLFFVSHFGPKRGIPNSQRAMFRFLSQGPHHNSSGAYSKRSWPGVTDGLTRGYWRIYISSSDGRVTLWESPAAASIALVGWAFRAQLPMQAKRPPENWRSSPGHTDAVKCSYTHWFKLSKASFFHIKQLCDTQSFSLKSRLKANAILECEYWLALFNFIKHLFRKIWEIFLVIHKLNISNAFNKNLSQKCSFIIFTESLD